MQLATVTSTSPLEVLRHNGDTDTVPVSLYPLGMTFDVNDLVDVDTVGGRIVVRQKLTSV